MTVQTPQLDQPAPANSTAADRQAASNYLANHTALAGTQPRLAARLAGRTLAVSWVYGRDGSLTARNQGGQWYSGCSLPHRAVAAMLNRLEVRGTTACFLSPDHAAMLQVALDKLQPHQSIIAIIPDLDDLHFALHCGNFAGAIAAHRLWFAAGDDWPGELTQLLREHPGLAEPEQFIRAPTLDERTAAELIPRAQSVLASESQRRRSLIGDLRRRPPATDGPIGIVAPSRFRLWNDAGQVLAESLMSQPGHWRRLDSDDPASASSLALAHLAAQSRAIVAANVTRADWPDAISRDTPVITWLTVCRIIPFARVGPRDGLLLADEAWIEPALRAGWPRNRLGVAHWPVTAHAASPAGPAFLALIADTSPISADEARFELSSHRLLWDLIAQELSKDPLAPGDDVGRYLSARMQRLSICPDGFDRAQFIERLILPAFQQGVARIAIREGLPLKLYGEGWSAIEQLAERAAGAIRSRAELFSAAAAAAGLLHAWPVGGFHPILTLGRPVVRPAGRNGGWLGECRRVLAGTVGAPGHPQRTLDGDLVESLL